MATERIDVRGPGYREDVLLHNGTATWAPTITLPTGTSKIIFSLAGPKYDAPGDPRPLQFALVNYHFGSQYDSAVEGWAHKLSSVGCEGS